LPDLPRWRHPEQIAELATLLVMMRPGWSVSEPPAPFRCRHVSSPLLDISSSDLRQRVLDRRSIRYLTPRAVECYIEAHRLYR